MPDYDFRTLSPFDFERLVRDLLQELLQIKLKAFAHGPDGGVDLQSTVEDKRTIVQCKHYRGSKFSDLKKAAAAEKAKMDELEPDDYFFVTSQSLGLSQQEALVKILSPHLSGVDKIFALLDLNDLLRQFPEIELDHFKLWMASASVIRRIVETGIWQRSAQLMEDVKDRVQLYVSSPIFSDARHMLDEKKVCVITGAPGVGKSMLAEMLCLLRWEKGWEIVNLPSQQIDRAWDVWKNDCRQFFFFDDVFGQTNAQEGLSRGGGKSVAQLIRQVAKATDKQLVITTRTHILQEAEFRDEDLSRAGLHARECVVELSEYTMVRRARILYNHLYFSTLPRDVVREFAQNNYYWPVIQHENFTPRLIHLTIEEHQNDGGAADALRARMLRALDHPIDLWGPSFREALSEPARRILMHLVTFPTYGAPSELLRDAAVRDASPVEYSRAKNQLEGSWINIGASASRAGTVVTFHNPSCRDFVLSYLDSEPLYVYDIMRKCTDSFQLSQLIGYGNSASSRSSARSLLPLDPKYPGLLNALSTVAAELASLVRDAWSKDSGEALEYSAETLDTLMAAERRLKLGLHEWVIDQILNLSSRSDDFSLNSDRITDSNLAEAVMRAGREPSTIAEGESCKLVLFDWCGSIGEATLWSPVFEFRDWLSGTRFWNSDDEDRIYRAFDTWLDGEFESILDVARDADQAMDYVQESINAAERYFGPDAFRRRFETFEETAEAKTFSDESGEDYDDDDTRAAEAIESPDESDTSTGSIRSLFHQLM